MTEDQSVVVPEVDDEPETDVQILSINVGGRDYPIKFVPQCDTCTSPARFQIERMLIEGQRKAYILREVARIGYDPVPSIDSLYKHVNRKHTSVVAERNQRIIEQTAEDLGRAIDESVEQEITQLALARKIVDIRGRDMWDGTEKPNDAAFKIAWDYLRDMDARIGGGSTIDAKVYQRVIEIILEISSEHARDSAALGEAIMRDPFVAAFARAARGEETEPQALTAS